MRTLVLIGLLLLTAYVTVTGSPLSASAAPAETDTPASAGQVPLELGTGRVADLAGVLSAEQVTEIDAASRKLSSDEHLDVWIVLVDRFAEPEDAQQWADAVAEKNGLGPQQYLLAIATEGRTFFLSAPSLGRVSDSRLLEIERRLIAPQLTEGDFTGAALATFSGLSEPMPAPTPTASTATATADKTIITPGIVVAVIILVSLPFLLVALLIWILIRRRRASRALSAARAATVITATTPAPAQVPAPAPAPIRLPASAQTPPASAPPPVLRPIADLGRDADSALVTTDDAVRMADQDLGFAAAQYGDSSVGDFTEALARAKRNLAEAFTLKQKLTDETPDTEQEIREWTTRILALCATAMADVQAQQQGFAALRRIEADAGALLASAREEVLLAETRIPAAGAELDRLRARYGASVLAEAGNNLSRAGALIAAAHTELESAESGTARGDSAAAALAIQRAQKAAGQATTLASTISTRAGELAEAASRVLSQSMILAQLITIARGIPENVNVLTPLASLAEQTVALARTDANPLRALDKLREASAALTHAIEDVQRSRAESAEAAAGFAAAPAVPTTPEDAKLQARAAKDLARAQKAEARRARIARENVARAERDQIRAIERARELEREQARQRRAERTESRRPRDSGSGSSSGGRGRSGGGGGRF
ncbi:TPM domain-containing protein [Mycetocola saprophilus]|uniref:TPM domain-containing protein n=1 Tax=Mycetocola saprophilus TaxID=76636 RepID=UPI0005BCBCC1|nr:TPM domain-containing protein [Mycetocola saprophilus]